MQNPGRFRAAIDRSTARTQTVSRNKSQTATRRHRRVSSPTPDSPVIMLTVVAVALGADRRDDVVVGEAVGVADAEVLHAAVAVVDQAGDVDPGALTVPDGHLEG